MKYRFKTEEEMIKEFGIHWKDTAFSDAGWNNLMDKYLGDKKVLKGYKPNRYNTFGLYDESIGRQWTISMGMITTYEDVPNYNPRKIIKDLD